MRPIRLTEDAINAYMAALKEQLANMRMYKKTTFSIDPAKSIKSTTRPVINFNALAYLKMLTLVDSCSTECAWHGVVEANEEHTRFDIVDILVYPQTISGSTVQTDELKYTEWKNALSDDIYNSLRMQGHSHVNFGATPSGVDTTLYENMLNVMNQNSYYIFMITNKKRSFWFEIHDLANNIIYETADIYVTVSGEDLEAWYKTQKEMFKTQTIAAAKAGVVYGGPQYAQRNYRDNDYGCLPGFNDTPPVGRNYSLYDDDDDDAFSAYEGKAAMRQAAPKENKKRGRPRKEK